MKRKRKRFKKTDKRIKRWRRRRRRRWEDVTISTSPGEYRGVTAHPSAPAHHLQSVQTSCFQAGENTAVSSWTHFLQVHQLSTSLEHRRGHLLRVLQQNLLHETECDESVVIWSMWVMHMLHFCLLFMIPPDDALSSPLPVCDRPRQHCRGTGRRCQRGRQRDARRRTERRCWSK